MRQIATTFKTAHALCVLRYGLLMPYVYSQMVCLGTSNILKAVFHKFYLVHSSTPQPTCAQDTKTYQPLPPPLPKTLLSKKNSLSKNTSN